MPGTVHQPQPALDHLHPRFQSLIDHSNNISPLSPKAQDASSPHSEYLIDNGFYAMSQPGDVDYLDNAVHPIFRDDNCVGHMDKAEKKAILPALRLASKFLTDETLANWWIHAIYGRRAYNAEGRIYLAEDPRENPPEAYNELQQKLNEAAGTIKFSFVSPDLIEGYNGLCYRNLEQVAKELENLSCSVAHDRFWYNPWTSRYVPAVLMNMEFLSDVCDNQGTTSSTLRCAFNPASALVHEVAHACVEMWQQDGAMIDEPLDHHNDHFAECGYAWEQFAFGLHCVSGPSVGKMRGENFLQSHPKQGASSIPIAYLIPDHWINSWFDQKTWASMADQHAKLRDSLQDHSTAVLMVPMKWEDAWFMELYHRGQRVSTDHERAAPRQEPDDRSKHSASFHWGETVADIAETYRRHYEWSLDKSEWDKYESGPEGTYSHYAKLTYINPQCRFRHLEKPSEETVFDVTLYDKWYVKYMNIDPMALKWVKGQMQCTHRGHHPKWTVANARPFSLRVETPLGSNTKRLGHANKPSTQWVMGPPSQDDQKAKNKGASAYRKQMEQSYAFLHHRLRKMDLGSIARDTYTVVEIA